MAIASTAIRFDTFVVDEYALQPAEAGKRLGQMVKAKVADPKCLCILSDGLMGNCTDFLKALHDEMGAVPIVGGGLTEGNRIQLTRRDPEKIKRSAQSCAARVLDSHNGEAPAFVLQFDCADRGRILFGACTAAEIVVPLRKTLGATTPWLGFHTHGEIAPLDGRPYYHNYTVGLFAVYDRAA
jgi:small ligand-binding sensory domain FIST